MPFHPSVKDYPFRLTGFLFYSILGSTYDFHVILNGFMSVPGSLLIILFFF